MKTNRKVYVASVTTESSDHYSYAFEYKPTHNEVCTYVWEAEGKAADLEWYIDLTSVTIEEITVRTKK